MAVEQALLTVPDAAAVLSVSPRSIRKWIASGRLPAVHIARAVRVRRRDVERVVAGGLAVVERRA